MWKGSDVTPKNTDHLFIFVSGIPSTANSPSVLEHFRKIGNVKIHRLESKKYGSKILHLNPSTNTRRGFCVLQAMDGESYQAILTSTSCLFQGRSLAISRFRQGEELLSHNCDVNSKKLILKKVPAGTSIELLQAALENQFGPIDRIYRYEAESPEKKFKKEKTRKTNTFSVQFLNSESAEKVVETRVLVLYLDAVNSISVITERFQRQGGIQPDQEAYKGEFPSKLNMLNKVKTPFNLPTELKSYQNSQMCYFESNESRPKDEDDALGNRPQSLIKAKLDFSEHNYKPTSSNYFMVRANWNPQGKSIVGDKPSAVCLRYNILKTRVEENANSPSLNMVRPSSRRVVFKLPEPAFKS